MSLYSQKINLIELNTLYSTSGYLKQLYQTPFSDIPTLCWAKQQTQGYGQRQQQWHSNAKALTFSIAYPLAKTPKQPLPPQLSLSIACDLHRAIQQQSQTPAYVKWPNDLYTAEGKAAGLLIEVVNNHEQQVLVIGIGINCQAHTFGKNGYFADVGAKTLMNALIEQWQTTGLVGFDWKKQQTYWQQHDYFRLQESIDILLANEAEKYPEAQSGYYLGIDGEGRAQVILNGVTHRLLSGQNSLRKRNHLPS